MDTDPGPEEPPLKRANSYMDALDAVDTPAQPDEHAAGGEAPEAIIVDAPNTNAVTDLVAEASQVDEVVPDARTNEVSAEEVATEVAEHFASAVSDDIPPPPLSTTSGKIYRSISTELLAESSTDDLLQPIHDTTAVADHVHPVEHHEAAGAASPTTPGGKVRHSVSADLLAESSTDDHAPVAIIETNVDAPVIHKPEHAAEQAPTSPSKTTAAVSPPASPKDVVIKSPTVIEATLDAPAPAAAPIVDVVTAAVMSFESKPTATDAAAPAAAPAPEVKAEPKVVAPEAIALSDDHFISLEEVSQRNPDSRINAETPKESQGLSAKQAADRLAVHGRNALTPPPATPWWLLFFYQFKDPFIILLLVAAALSFGTFSYTKATTDLISALALIVVALIQAVLTWIQELKAANVMAQFANMLQAQCHVIRDGVEEIMDAELLVVGDVVLIKGGDKVPADCRILFSQGLKVENASLTGESRPILLDNKPSAPGLPPTEALCLAYKGSFAIEGEAYAVVLRTGDRTFIGQIASLTSNAKHLKTTLEIEVNHFIKFIVILSITTGSIAFIIAIARSKGKNALKLIIQSFVVVILANVPQGLPATVTSLLSITAARMAKRNVLVRKLHCVETLGCTTVICSDKTGTLTKNEMTVTECWVDRKNRTDDYGSLFVQKQRGASRVRTNSSASRTRPSESSDTASIASGASTASGARRDRVISREALSPNGGYLTSFEILHRLGTVCNKGIMNKKTATDSKGKADDEKIEWIGNASDLAVLKFCHNLRSSNNIRQAFPIDFEIPFNSSNKWMLTLCHDPTLPVFNDNRMYQVMMKGAPEIILDRCNTYLYHGEERIIDEHFQDEFDEAYERYGNKGCRVLGLAQRTFSEKVNATFDSESDNYPTNDLCFVGLFAITDPPRDGVRDAIEKCHTAGIKVFMVTGDHHLTAKAIAKQVGILDENANDETDRYTVILGVQLASLNEDDWKEISKRGGVVFARTTPQHKLIIVQNCQKNGHIVAVTGDGVNDAPALKNAHIGVAMGLNGSDVAREAASLVLLDDNFASIVLAIEQGRIIFDNLKKSIAYTLAHLLPELVAVLPNLFFGLPPALSTLQVISIDLGTELGPAISLAYEGPESDIMRRAPRSTKIDRLVSRPLLMYSYVWIGLIETIFAGIAYFWSFGLYNLMPSDIVLTSDAHFGNSGNDEPFLNYSDSQQQSIGATGASSFFLVLVLSQGFHVFMCKTSRVSIFKHKQDNPLTIYGVLVQIALCVIFVYIPGIQTAFFSGDVSFPGWISLACVGLLICVFNEWRKWYFRGHETAFLTRELRW